MSQQKFKLIFILLISISLFFLCGINLAEAANDYNNIELEQVNFTVDMGVNIILLIATLALFLWEPLSIGVLSLSIPVLLILLDSWTGITTSQALSGFSNNATITVMAMFILSKGIQNSGGVQYLGSKIEQITKDNSKKQVGVISLFTGGIASAVNNTPVVAAFIPMVTNLARRTKTSPSKLLIPLSYASMLGGTITLIGTSTNILASDISARLIDKPFRMFEFTHLGLITFVVGILYLLTIGYKLVPARIKYANDLIDEYDISEYLTKLKVRDDSPLVGSNIEEIFTEDALDLDVVCLIRDGEKYIEPLDAKTLVSGDRLIIRAEEKVLLEFIEDKGLTPFPSYITQTQLESSDKRQKIIELVVPDNSFLTGRTINEVDFLERYNASLLGIRYGEDIKRANLNDFRFEPGNILLLLVDEETTERLKKNKNNFIIEELKIENEEIQAEEANYERNNIITSLAIIAAVIILGALGWLPISVAALGGVIAMIATENVKAEEAYQAIDWDVIFLLAGLIPLGIAIEQTGTASYIAMRLINASNFLPPIIILAIFYLFTAILTSLISNNASAVLMIPIAVEAASQLGANPFAFIMAVTFAASGSFITPIGYQTNLMVYGPGGYKFKDFLVVGVPLQLILTFIIPIFIALFWGV